MSKEQKRRQKILIADDSEMNRSILADMLEEEFDIIEAENGLEAVSILQQCADELSLVLLDIVMPEMDGFEVLMVMNQRQWIEDVPVIMISAETRSSQIERAYKLGITDFISRPFDALIVHHRVVNTILLYTKQKKLVDLVEEQIYQKERHGNLMIEILSRFSGKARALGGNIEEIEVQDSYKHYQKIANVTSFAGLRQWWSDFVRQFTAQFFTRQKKSESDIIQNALNYIEDNLDKPIQLSDVARQIGVSEPYLSSFFKSSMNENFIPYVNRQKMKRARQLFAEGRMVYQVSELLGYENTTYFSKVFKRVEGMTPEQYQKNLH